MLQALRDEVADAIKSNALSTTTVELDQAKVGRLSRIDDLQRQQMAKANHRALELRLKMIDMALQAIDDGSYGDCRTCEEPIGFPRLRAKPETPFCIKCQSVRDG